MNKLLTAFFTFSMLFSFSVLVAQSHVCGTSDQTQYDARERLFQNRTNAANQETASSRDVTVYVPLKFHIVTKTNGSFGISEATILNLLCTINAAFEDQDMIFYINYPFNYINNTNLFDDPGSVGGLNTIAWNWDDNSVNVFIVNEAGPGVAGYYLGPFMNYPYEHIIIQKSSVGGNTAPHELGHFFSLAHPFFGWGQAGDTGWDPAVHGNPVGLWAPDGSPNEKMDGSNCMTAADGICDTPPDYFFATSPVHDGDCSWEGGAKDPNNVLVVTMEENMMNYFDGCGEYVFTDDQKDAIRADFNSPFRSYIRHSYVPPHDVITEAPELVEPINNEITAGYNAITFDWDEPDGGAQRYLLEIDQQPTFGFLPKRFIIANGTSTEIEDIFSPNVTYYWRVTPYNDGNTCNLPTSAVESFVAGENVSTKEIEAVNDWAIFPNPASQIEMLTIQVEADEAFDADIRLYNMTGQLVKTVKDHQFNIGANNYNMNISGINTGMYIVTIQTDKGVNNKRLVITE